MTPNNIRDAGEAPKDKCQLCGSLGMSVDTVRDFGDGRVTTFMDCSSCGASHIIRENGKDKALVNSRLPRTAPVWSSVLFVDEKTSQENDQNTVDV